MSRAPWWTDADEAELAVAVRAYVDMVATHKFCPQCARARRTTGLYFCQKVGEASDALAHWVEWRRLRSKADYLRRRHLLRALNLIGQTEAA